MKNNFLKVVLLVLLVTTVLVVASCQRTEEALAGLATKSKASACVGRDCPAMDVIKAEYAKMGLSEKQMYQDMLYSNTLLYDGKQDYFLLYDLNTINDKKASPKVKAEAKANVYKKVNKMYSQFSGKSLRDTSWLISNEKYLKSMMFDKLSLSDSNKLLDPKDLQELLAQTGECMEKQKQQGDVVGGAKEEGKEGAEGAAGTGGISGACNTFGRSGLLLGSPGLGGGGGADSIIACLEAYKASKDPGPPGGKGGPPGGGVNPGPMTGGAVAGSKLDPKMTTEGSGGEGAPAGRLSGSGSCFGLDMGKMGGFAGKPEGMPAGAGCGSNCAGLTKTSGWSTRVTFKDSWSGSVTTITESFIPNSKDNEGNVWGTTTTKTETKDKNGKVTHSETKPSGTPGLDGGSSKQIEDQHTGSVEEAEKKGKLEKNAGGATDVKVTDSPPASPGSAKYYNPESDSGTPCGADAAGLAACVMGSGKKSAGEQFKEMVAQCMTPGGGAESSGGSSDVIPAKGDGSIKSPTPTFSDKGACAGFGGACFTYLNNLYGVGAGIKDVDPNEPNPCGVDASEAMDSIMQTLVIDPLPMNLMFSSIILQEAGIKAEGISGIGFEKGIEGLEKVAGSGAAKQGRAAAEGAGGCIGAGCK